MVVLKLYMALDQIKHSACHRIRELSKGSPIKTSDGLRTAVTKQILNAHSQQFVAPLRTPLKPTEELKLYPGVV